MKHGLRIFLLLTSTLFLVPIYGFGHGGRTNANGCHTNKKTGDYHCHGTPKSSNSNQYSKSDSSSIPKATQIILPAIVITPASSLSPFPEYLLSEVEAGDTVIIRNAWTVLTVKLLGVTAPDPTSSDPSIKSAAIASRNYLRSLTINKWGKVEYDAQTKDANGKPLVYLYTNEGTFLNATMIKAGHAVVSSLYPFRYAESFKKYQQEFQTQRSIVPQFTSSASGSTTREQSVQVYRTKTGAKYHRAGCRSLSRSMIRVTLEVAKSMGLGACLVCNPVR